MSSKASCLMFQGTGSNVGKSILTAALCRVLKNDGVKVAPFKAQNMSNNSFVTIDQREISRAQAVQAQACGVSADSRFSPIILKPNSDIGSQVIENGLALGHMSIAEYHDYKLNRGREVVYRLFDELSEEYDVIILEGAGSPAEINLKEHDIVNMNMALYAQSPVLLIGNIHLGGVYASFLGTMQILTEEERELVQGYIVNRFRGDQELLKSAHEYMVNKTNKHVIGVMPEMMDFKLPEEDSVNFDFNYDDSFEKCDGIKIGIIDLPHISNYNDFDPFLHEPDVQLSKISNVNEVMQFDVIILPGSKNTLGDLKYLKDKGIVGAIQHYVEVQRGEVVGICAGFQMLGNELSDESATESKQVQLSGLGLLNMHTIMKKDKLLKQTKTSHIPSEHVVEGYEVHHGVSHYEQCIELFKLNGLGVRSSDKNVWGTYLHGLFDSDVFRHWFIDEQRKRLGLKKRSYFSSQYQIESSLNKIAEVFKENVDMNTIYKLLNLNV